jgi:hypothetical protein
MKRPSLVSHLSWLCFVLLNVAFVNVAAQSVNIAIDIDAGNKLVSPYIYGKNNTTSGKVNSPLTQAQWTQVRESGATFLRENYGNESSKYNWKKKLTSSPDWYNAVSDYDWDFEAQSIKTNLPNVQAMFGFQLLGHVAKSKAYNWDAWSYHVNNNLPWPPCSPHQNLAGGGEPNITNPDSHKAAVDGDMNLYLEPWTIDESIEMLDHWFGPDGIGLDSTKLRYWSMDNEPDLWSGTHDDVRKTQLDAEAFMQIYFEAAKKARSKFPGIKIVGPIASGEWFWYNWPGGTTVIDGKKYCWLEYFIKRVAQEEAASGIKLLDVFALHFYPGEKVDEQAVQTHRIFFDENYAYPGANGVSAVNGGWDTSIKKEYVFKRCNDWLAKYMGPNHKVKLGITECGVKSENPNVAAVWYASMLGEFMRHNEVEIFTPWTWRKGMWETLHLFARYNKPTYVETISDNEELVSAYATKNATADSLVVVLVNRSKTDTKVVTVSPANFILGDGPFDVRTLSDLPLTTETFVSHTQNALKSSVVSKTNNSITLSLAPFSVTSVALKGAPGFVDIPVTSVNISPSSATIGVGFTTQLSASVTPANATNKSVSWSSSNIAVATVDDNGLVLAVAPGSAVITATTHDGGLTSTSNIVVSTSYQAEMYTSESGTAISAANSGFTGTGYVDYGGNGSWIEWNNITRSSSGSVKIYFRYANGSTGNRQCEVLINGAVIGNIAMKPSGGWTVWGLDSITATIPAGTNTIRVMANTSSGGPNLDRININDIISTSMRNEKPTATESFVLYPNPVTSSEIFVKMDVRMPADVDITIFDMLGEAVLVRAFPAAGRGWQEFPITHNLAPGVYVFVLQTSGQFCSMKLIVK